MAGLAHTSAVVLAWIGLAAARATVPLALAAVGTSVLRRRAAALRHLLWTVALAVSVALLVLPALLPAWPVVPAVSWPPRPASSAPRSAAAAAIDWTAGPFRADAPASRDRPEASFHRPAASPTRGPVLAHGSVWLLGLWGTGCLLVLGRFGWSLVQLARLSRRAASWTAPEAERAAAPMASAMGIRRRVRLLVSEEVESATHMGSLRPRVIGPGRCPHVERGPLPARAPARTGARATSGRQHAAHRRGGPRDVLVPPARLACRRSGAVGARAGV